MQPIGRPFNEEERLTFRALYFLERGLSHAEIVQRLTSVNSQLGEAGAERIIGLANVARANVVGASFSDEGETLASATGQPDRQTPVIVSADLAVTTPNGTTQTHTIRLDSVNPGDTIGDVRSRIEALAEDAIDTYFGDGATYTFALQYIL